MPLSFRSTDCLQTHNRGDERGDEEQTPERGRLMEEENAHKNGAHSANARPHWIGGAERHRLGDMGKKSHADKGKGKKTAHPAPPLDAFNGAGASETIGEAHLA